MDAILKASLPKLREKLLEALQAVLPIAAIVLVLCFTIAPVSPSILLCFLLGAAMIVVGIMFFTLGAEMSMTPMGERVGAVITKSRKLPVILGIGFLLGFLITISEPDLQVLANQVPSIPNRTLILSVAAGVGLFLVFAFLRMLIGISLPKLLVLFYGMIFLLAAFVPKEFLAVAFDSGGVTTGPMTVPFIMALGVGVSAIRGDRHAADDSFGLVAMCSIGPILAVLLLGCFLLAMFSFSFSKNLFLQQLKNFFFVPRSVAEMTETALERRFQWFFILQTAMLLGIIYYVYQAFYLHTDFVIDSQLALIALFAGFFTLYFGVKYGIYKFVNWVFFHRQNNEQWNRSWRLLSATEGVLLFPLVLLVVYFDLPLPSAFIYTASIIVLVKILTFYKSFTIFFSQSNVHLQIILYFCALELMPIVTSWGILEMIASYLNINF